MAVDWQWPAAPPEVQEKLGSPGREEMRTGLFVPEEDAYRHVLERISQDADLEREFEEMVVEWFYSGGWVRKYQEG